MIVFNCLQVIINSYIKIIHPLNHFEIIDINKSYLPPVSCLECTHKVSGAKHGANSEPRKGATRLEEGTQSDLDEIWRSSG